VIGVSTSISRQPFSKFADTDALTRMSPSSIAARSSWARVNGTDGVTLKICGLTSWRRCSDTERHPAHQLGVIHHRELNDLGGEHPVEQIER
jgi:hypothetical protein